MRERGAGSSVKCQRLTLVLCVYVSIEGQDGRGLRWRRRVGLVNAGCLLPHYSWASLSLAGVSSLSPPLNTMWRGLGGFLSWEMQLAEQRLKSAAVVGELSFHFCKRGELCATGPTFSFFFSNEEGEKQVIYNVFSRGHGEHSLENTTWPVTLRHPTPLHIFVI